MAPSGRRPTRARRGRSKPAQAYVNGVPLPPPPTARCVAGLGWAGEGRGHISRTRRPGRQRLHVCIYTKAANGMAGDHECVCVCVVHAHHPLTAVLSRIVIHAPALQKLAAGVNNGAIWTSANSGATWTEQTSAGIRQWRAIASSADGTVRGWAGLGWAGLGRGHTSRTRRPGRQRLHVCVYTKTANGMAGDHECVCVSCMHVIPSRPSSPAL
jgi:hypothetical protein